MGSFIQMDLLFLIVTVIIISNGVIIPGKVLLMRVVSLKMVLPMENAVGITKEILAANGT